jgi:hypothetical protein
MYLNRWTPNFISEPDDPFVVPRWVRLLHLPLHCWNEETMRHICNSIDRCIDRSLPKDNMFAYARICVEVALEKGLSKVVRLTLDN